MRGLGDKEQLRRIRGNNIHEPINNTKNGPVPMSMWQTRVSADEIKSNGEKQPNESVASSD
jgi:hypothetical protein